ncbi:MAG: hypothetical protein RLZZ546_265 [Bacteroidota bacterium]|jgi:hypothetical protein
MKGIFNVMQKERDSLAKIANQLSDEVLNQIPEGFNNNILWNLGHIVVIEQFLCRGLCNQPLQVSPELISLFKKNSKPTGIYSTDIKEQIINLLITSPVNLEQDYNAGILKLEIPFDSKTLDTKFTTIEEIIPFNLYHEGLHTGVIQKYIQIFS